MSFRRGSFFSEEEAPRGREFSPQELEKFLGGKLKRLRDGNWKLDLAMGLEVFWLFLIITSIGFLFFSIAIGMDRPELRFLIPLSAILLIASIFLLKNTDNYYIIDRSRNRLLYVSKFFSNYTEKEVANFDDFIGILIVRKVGKKRRVSLYLYGLLKNGESIVLSDSYANWGDDPDKIHILGEKVAELMGVPFFPLRGEENPAILKMMTNFDQLRAKNIEVETGENPHQIVILDKSNGKNISIDFSNNDMIRFSDGERVREINFSSLPGQPPSNTSNLKIKLFIIAIFLSPAIIFLIYFFLIVFNLRR